MLIIDCIDVLVFPVDCVVQSCDQSKPKASRRVQVKQDNKGIERDNTQAKQDRTDS